MSKIRLLPGAELTPKVLLHQCLETLDGVKGVIVLTIDENDVVDVSTSRISLAMLAFSSLKLQLYTAACVSGEEPESRDTFIPPSAS